MYLEFGYLEIEMCLNFVKSKIKLKLRKLKIKNSSDCQFMLS